MANKWLVHIKKTMKQMKAKGTYVAGKGLGQVIKAAKKTWHSAKKAVGLKGGAEGDDKDDGEMKDVPLEKSDSEDEEAASSGNSSGMEIAGEKVTGGRHRKTRRRRRRHSRRR
jgi:hypothetical protein